MGWGLIINNVYVNRIRKDDIEPKIYECEKSIQYCHENLVALASACPRDIKDGDDMITWEEHVLRETERLVDEIVESAQLLNLLYIAKEADDKDIEEDI